MSDDAVSALVARIYDALSGILDPEIGGNIVDLGLIYEVSVEADGVVAIAMTTTSRGCPAAGFLRDAVEASVVVVDGVSRVAVELVYEPRWTPDRIRASALKVVSRH